MKKLFGLATVALMTLSLAAQAANVRTAPRTTTMTKAQASQLLKSGQSLSSAQLNAVLAAKGAQVFTNTVDKLVSNNTVNSTQGDFLKSAYVRGVISAKDAVSCLKGMVEGVDTDKSKLALSRYAEIVKSGAESLRSDRTYVSVATKAQLASAADEIISTVSKELNISRTDAAVKAKSIGQNCNISSKIAL